MVEIVGKEYSESEWKAALKSNKGIFKRIGQLPTNIVGPTLIEDFDIIGNIGSIETADILLCTKQQQFVFHDLMKRDEFEKAIEFVFTITNADVIWKRKIKLLQDLLAHIKLEENQILSEEAVVEKAEKMKGELFDSELEKYFPDDFKLLREDVADLHKFAEDLEKVEAHLEAVEKKINKHIARLQAQFPFLFE